MDSPGTTVSAAHGGPGFRERRKRPRHKIHTPAYASFTGLHEGMVVNLNEILDLSEDGLLLQCSTPFDPKRILNLCLDLSENKSNIYATGEVAWSLPSGRTGIRFPELPEDSRRQIRDWLLLNSLVGCSNNLEAATEDNVKLEVSAPVTSAASVLPDPGPDAFAAPPDHSLILSGLAAVQREVEGLGADLDSALQLIAERATAFTRCTGAAVALAEGDDLVCCASSGADAPPLESHVRIGSGFSGECARSGRLLKCDDAETDSRVDREACRDLGIRSMIAAPVRLGDSVIGIVEVFSPRANVFGETDVTTLQRLAETVLAAVNRAARERGVKVSSVSAPAARPATPTSEPLILAEPQAASSRKIVWIAVAITLVLIVLLFIISRVRNARAAPEPTRSAVQPVSGTAQPIAMTEGGALDQFRVLAEKGDPAAQFSLGARYATGDDVKQDYTEAVRWFSKAAEQGHIVSQATLGAYYWAGRGVPQDLGKAYFWSVLAETGGDEASKYRVQVLTSRMSRPQIIAAQQKANEWLQTRQASSALQKRSPAR